MSQVFIANPEQEALIAACKVAAAKFSAQPLLHGSRGAIQMAKALIDDAAKAGLPQVAYVSLQMAVSMAETDRGLPSHLRQYPVFD